MKKLIVVGVVGAIVFAASFIGSSFLLQQNEAKNADTEQDETSETDMKMAKADSKKKSGKQDPMSSKDLPAPFKPKSLSEDSLLKMVESIQKREAAVLRKEKEILDRESRHRFILNDIQREKREYEAVSAEVQAKIDQAKRILQTVEQKKKEILLESQKIKEMQGEIEKNATPRSIAEQNNIKKIAEWIQSMPADDAAKTFKRYADDGKMVMAAKILRQIEERTAAKILSAMNDPVLVTQILDEFKNTIPTKKR